VYSSAPYSSWLPIGTDARVRGTPWVTLTAVAANLAIFAAIQLSPGGEMAVYRLAFKVGHPTIPSALVSLFLHVGALQLAGNMVLLSIFGPAVESRLGPGRYLIAYLACGWLANLAQAAWIVELSPALVSLPILGASGCVAGVLGVFLVRLYFAHVIFASLPALVRQGVLRPGRFAIPAAAAVGAWLLTTVASQIAGTSSETAAVCQWSGLAIGAVFAWAMGLAPEARLEHRLSRAGGHAARGQWFAALRDYEDYLGFRPEDPEAAAQVARIHRVTRQEALAAEWFLRAIHLRLERGEVREACDTYEEMKRLLGPVPVPAGDLLRLARACEELARPGDASRAYEAFGRQYPELEGSAVALLKSAEIEHRTLRNPGRARYLYDELLRRSLRPDIERLVRARAAGADAAAAPEPPTTAGSPARSAP
jgi:membrane associated rhomboid family serine protease